jgi:hypothetical protein
MVVVYHDLADEIAGIRSNTREQTKTRNILSLIKSPLSFFLINLIFGFMLLPSSCLPEAHNYFP